MRFYNLCVTNPPAVYAENHFPRRFRYLKDAIAAAEEAVAMGASLARVECPDGSELDHRPQERCMKWVSEFSDVEGCSISERCRKVKGHEGQCGGWTVGDAQGC